GVGLAGERLERRISAYGDKVCVELPRHGLDSARAAEGRLIDLADRHGLPLVATNEPFFARETDYEAHDALLAIADGRLVADDKRRRLSPEHRLKTRAGMGKLLADLREALASVVEIG